MIDRQQLKAILPTVIAWAEDASASALQTGLPLESPMIELARSVGVAHPDRIRTLVTTQVPYPDDPLLMEAGLALGLTGPSASGMTLGYAVFLQRGASSVRLLSHEFRHVHQYEQAGSLKAFLTGYLGQIVSSGYQNAPMEADARAHERLELPESFHPNDPSEPNPISREHAARIADAAIRQTRYDFAEPPVRRVVHVTELGEIQPPRPYALAKRLEETWICYVDRELLDLRSSLVVLVCRTTGLVEYLGSANDEG